MNHQSNPQDQHGHDEDLIGPHVTLKGYLQGFVLAVLLTAIPFWLVMSKVIPDARVLTLVITAFAALQIVVHMKYFLHMDMKSEGGWNMLALVFTLVVVMITLAGSIWVMYHLDTNMMPGMMPKMTPEQAKNLP